MQNDIRSRRCAAQGTCIHVPRLSETLFWTMLAVVGSSPNPNCGICQEAAGSNLPVGSYFTSTHAPGGAERFAEKLPSSRERVPVPNPVLGLTTRIGKAPGSAPVLPSTRVVPSSAGKRRILDASAKIAAWGAKESGRVSTGRGVRAWPRIARQRTARERRRRNERTSRLSLSRGLADLLRLAEPV